MEGGILCSDNEDIINQAKVMRAHGWVGLYKIMELNLFVIKEIFI